MLFNSVHFLLFFPIVTLAYFCLPHKIRWIWLLVCSYYFYMSWNPTYAILLFASTFITYISGILIDISNRIKDEKKSQRQKKLWVALSFTSNLLILFFFKYLDFAIDNINVVFSHIGIKALQPSFDIILPVGISFYTFQALGYTMDVYRKEINAEKNLGKYALFVSFFPQLVAGPIERSKNLLLQIHEKHYFNVENVKNGLLMMLWGFFQKIVIADRVAIIVNRVYDDPTSYTGISIMFATVLFAVQIYCDFSGYSDIAIGAAQVMGFNLMQNFRQPYFSSSIQEFWQRWHISLSTWFKDYLYFPLGGSRCSKLKHYRNLMITFLVSGFWHGASWNYIIWGALHGIYQIVGRVFKPLKGKLYGNLHIKTDTFSFKLGQIFTTFFLVTFAWLFFRATTITDAFELIRRIFTNTGVHTMFSTNTYLLGTDMEEFVIMMFSIIILFAVSVLHAYKNISIRDTLSKQNSLFRWLVYFSVIFVLIRYGVYGADYAQTQFIYFQF